MKKIAQIILLQTTFLILSIGIARAASCGETFVVMPGGSTDNMCQCDVTDNQFEFMKSARGIRTFCCGVYANGQCRAYEDSNQYACGETNGSDTVPDGAICNCEGGQWESYWQSRIWNNKGICCGWTTEDRKQCLSDPPGANDVYCGTEFDPNTYPKKTCICSGQAEIDENTRCCGWLRDGTCQSTDSDMSNLEVSSELLDSLNPLSSGDSKDALSTPGGIISKALGSFVFPIAGIILFVVLLLGGFQMLSGAANSKSLEEGKQRITSAVIGFVILFAAYWIAQLLELIFGIRILS